jgi:hypothetical protein
MVMRRTLAAMALCLAMSVLAVTQAQPPQPPTPPTLQQEMMGYFAGDWKVTGTTKINPGSPSVPFHSTEHGEWVPGGYFLETHSVNHGPLGDVHGVRMMEYNPTNHVFTYNQYNSLGEHTVAVGNAEGNTWIWNADEKLNGVATKARYTLTLTSPTAYSYKSEVQKLNGEWVTITEGKATRVVTP